MLPEAAAALRMDATQGRLEMHIAAVDTPVKRNSYFSSIKRLNKVTIGVAKQHPSLLLVPNLLFCLFVALGVWAAVHENGRNEREVRTNSLVLARQVASTMQDKFLTPTNTLFAISLLGRAEATWSEVQRAFRRAAPDLMQTGAVIAIGMAPLGVLSSVYPPVWQERMLGPGPTLLPIDLMARLPAYAPIQVSNLPDDAFSGRLQQVFILVPEFIKADGMLVAPIFVPQDHEDMEFNRTSPLINCEHCDDGFYNQKFWGLAVVLLSLAATFVPDDPLVLPLHNAGLDFAASYYDPGVEPNVFQRSAGLPISPECVRHELPPAYWRLCVSPAAGWRQPWLTPVIIGVVILSALICTLVFMMQLSRLRHAMLLQSLVPAQLLKKMQHDNTFLQVPARPTFKAGTAADKILLLTDELLTGHEPDQREILLIRNAVLRNANIYSILDFGQELKAHALDDDVARALMRQLGGNTPLDTMDGRTSSSDSATFSMCASAMDGQGHNHHQKYATLAGGLNAILGIRRAGSQLHLSTHEFGLERTGSSASIRMLSLVGGAPVVPRAVARLSTSHPPVASPLSCCSESASLCGPAVSDDMDLSARWSIQPGDKIPIGRPILDQVEVLLISATEDFHFDAFALADATHGRPLSALAFYLFHTSGLVSRFKLPGTQLARFLTTCEDGYKANPYHNRTHAADVLQTYHVLLTKGGLVPGYADPLTLMACYIAAVVHDLEHVGKTNDFLINSSDPLAILYNDKTPMENHHVAAAFSLLRKPEYAFLSRLHKSDTDKLRKLVIELVLGTDMKQHFALISHFSAVHRLTTRGPSSGGDRMHPLSMDIPRMSRFTPNVDGCSLSAGQHTSLTLTARQPIDEAERLTSLQIALKCADLGHICEGLEVHLRWVGLLEAEFFAQGDREKELGFPISPLFDRTKPGVTKSQVGFFSFVVLPLFQAFTRVFPGTKPALDSINANFAYWESEEAQSK